MNTLIFVLFYFEIDYGYYVSCLNFSKRKKVKSHKINHIQRSTTNRHYIEAKRFISIFAVCIEVHRFLTFFSIFSYMFCKVKTRLCNAILAWIPSLSIQGLKLQLKLGPHTGLFEEIKAFLDFIETRVIDSTHFDSIQISHILNISWAIEDFRNHFNCKRQRMLGGVSIFKIVS